VVKETAAVVSSEQAVDTLRAMLPPAAPVIVAHWTLDRGSLELLRDFLDRLA
jgi:hypothetical protein